MLRSSSYRKGQWFILSAVFISTAFLVVSMMFKSYFAISSSSLAERSEVFFFDNTQEQLNRAVNLSACSDMEQNLKEFVYLSEKRAGGKGYLLTINRTVISCPPKSIRFTMVLASDTTNINKTWVYSP